MLSWVKKNNLFFEIKTHIYVKRECRTFTIIVYYKVHPVNYLCAPSLRHSDSKLIPKRLADDDDLTLRSLLLLRQTDPGMFLIKKLAFHTIYCAVFFESMKTMKITPYQNTYMYILVYMQRRYSRNGAGRTFARVREKIEDTPPTSPRSHDAKRYCVQIIIAVVKLKLIRSVKTYMPPRLVFTRDVTNCSTPTLNIYVY